MKLLRMLSRNIRDSFKSVFRNFALSLASISCITITLIVVSISIIMSANVNNFATLVEKDVTIVAFLDSNITDEQRTELWKNRDDIIGALCEVKYKEISSDKNTGLESLQFPVFVRIRTDKNEVSYG